MNRAASLTTTQLASESFLGARYHGNLQRLLDVDLEPLLAGFRSKPGEHPWIGEHIGKWLDAASLVVATTQDSELASKLRYAAKELIRAQEPDGYLGTYPPAQRFGMFDGADWDVWANKYCMIGLLAYYRASGDRHALDASRRVGDLLMHTFHDPGDKDILRAGTHMGMAATSVLQPIVELYSLTGEGAYLEFARGIIRAWDRPLGPKVMSTLLRSGRVNEVGNGKAYEMLSNLVGLADFAAVTGEREPRDAVMAAWEDIVTHHLYATGTMSFGEHFHEENVFPDSTSVNMGETCVTVTWIQLTQRLFQATGEPKYAAELERTYFNHLAAAQRPDGSGWCYYTPLQGAHMYGSGISCCISSGPRGLALLPHTIFSADGDQLTVAQYVPATATIEIDGRRVTIELETDLPYEGVSRLIVSAEDGEAVTLGVRWRVPEWARQVDGSDITPLRDGWATAARRSFQPGEAVELRFPVEMRTVQGQGSNAGSVAYGWGPLVLAYPRDDIAPALFDVTTVIPTGAPTPAQPLVQWRVSNPFLAGEERATVIGPFAIIASKYPKSKVWIASRRPSLAASAFQGASEHRSSGDISRGSIADYDVSSFAETMDAPAADDAWFALVSDNPVSFDRVLFSHGRSLVHGGWFDTIHGQPRIEIQRDAGEAWTTVALLEDYPRADAVWDGGLAAGQQFELVLTEPVTAVGLRVIGRGSYGEYPRSTRFATCSRLAAFLS